MLPSSFAGKHVEDHVRFRLAPSALLAGEVLVDARDSQARR